MTRHPAVHTPEAIDPLLTPETCALVLIDYQPQMAFAVRSIDGAELNNNATGLAKAAKVFNVPTILTTVATSTFSGPMFQSLLDVFPDQKPIDRTTMNTWEDENAKAAIIGAGRRRLIFAGLWTEVCIVMPAIQALHEGFEVYVVVDACGGTSQTSHAMAVERMVQAGAKPVTWLQVMLEWQRDWARMGTYEAVTGIAKEHAGAYGEGIRYAKIMFGGSEAATDREAALRRRSEARP